MTADELLARLNGVKGHAPQWTAKCPAHDDKKPSLSVTETADRVLLHCHAGCTFEEILDALGIDARAVTNGHRNYTLEDYAAEQELPIPFLQALGIRTDTETWGHPVIAIPYRSISGELVGHRYRGAEGAKWQDRGVKLVPYGLDRLPPDRPVLFVEGESDCHVAWHHGLNAVIGIPGAEAWKAAWAPLFQGREAYVWQEPDSGGLKLVNSLASSFPELRVVRAPEGTKDLAELHRQYGSAFRDRLKALLEQAEAPPPLQMPRVRNGGVARSLRELGRNPELLKPPAWDWQPYTAVGRASLISMAPKAGKTTLAAHYATAKSKGESFLGQRLQSGSVLWVGPDEALSDQVRRLHSLGAAQDKVFLWDGPIRDIEQVVAAARDCRVDLVIVDTLSRVARIADENDNAAWTAWWDRVLPAIRASRASWLFVHHDRKSGGHHGEGIRGASAIYASVDIAFSLQRVEQGKARRILRLEGTRYEDAGDLLIELRDNAYVALGDVDLVTAEEDPELAQVRQALTEHSDTVAEIARRLDPPIPEATLRRHLDTLVSLNIAKKTGKGGQRDPYRYSSSTASDPISGGAVAEARYEDVEREAIQANGA